MCVTVCDGGDDNDENDENDDPIASHFLAGLDGKCECDSKNILVEPDLERQHAQRVRVR